MGELWRALPFAQSILVWGYDVAGDAANVVATMAEAPNAYGAWDRRQEWLDRIERWHGGQRLHVPEWWALPAMTDWTFRREAAA